MNFGQLVRIVGNEPVFETGLLLCGDVDPADVRRQLSRWVDGGKVLKLRRGLYALAPPFRRVSPGPFVVANRLVVPSYVSLQSALAFFGLIPEHVPVITSVTPGRPGRWDTGVGSYAFRHLKKTLFFGYQQTELGNGQEPFVARPEKALLDLVYLEPGGESPGYLEGLRLQNLEGLDLSLLDSYAERSSRPKLRRAAVVIRAMQEQEKREYELP